MKDKPPIKVEFLIGTGFRRAIRHLLDVAARYNRIAETDFNGIRIRVNKRLPAAHVERQFGEAMDAAVRRFRASPEGKAMAAEQAIQEETSRAASLLQDLPRVAGLQAMVAWLGDFLPHADRLGPGNLDYATLDRMLGAKNLAEPNEHVGREGAWILAEPERMAQYIIGQARVSFREGHAPPQILQRFAKDCIEAYQKRTATA